MGDVDERPAGRQLPRGRHPVLARHLRPVRDAATLYTGFDYFDLSDAYHRARVYKSDGRWRELGVTAAASRHRLGHRLLRHAVLLRQRRQARSDEPERRLRARLVRLQLQPASRAASIRSTDGGATWKNLGYDLHPDFHAFAFQPNDTSHVAIGNDGGVWESHTGGGRNNAGRPPVGSRLAEPQRPGQSEHGRADPLHRPGASRSSARSRRCRTSPASTGAARRTTERCASRSRTTAGSTRPAATAARSSSTRRRRTRATRPCRRTSSARTSASRRTASARRETNTFFGNEPIDGGINLSDRSEFYIPWVQNRGNVNQMFLGTYRLYRTDNAETANAGDVTWEPISGGPDQRLHRRGRERRTRLPDQRDRRCRRR